MAILIEGRGGATPYCPPNYQPCNMFAVDRPDSGGDHNLMPGYLVRTCLVILLLAIAARASAGGAPHEDISVDSWVYDAVLQLSTCGLNSDILLHTRPWARAEVVQFLRSQNARISDQGAQILIERLRREFAEELSDESIPNDQVARLGWGPTARIDQFDGGFAKNRIGFDAVASMTLDALFSTRLRTRFDSDGRFDTQFHGRHWRNNLSAWVEQAVAVLRYKRFTAGFGREYWRWGRSAYDAMLISDNSPPFDGLRLMYRARNWSFAFHATQMDRTFVARSDYAEGEGQEGWTNRYLVAHRFNWQPRENLEVAVSEAMLFGGFERPWEFNYLNPFLPYYWEQLNYNVNDNPLWNVELSWRPRSGWTLYGEWMIDDFQIDFVSEPQQVGVLVGTEWAPTVFNGRWFLTGEYQRINTFVYGQDRPWNRYYHHRGLDGAVIGIGSSLGTDADRITVRPLYHLSEFLDVAGLVELTRRGEKRIDTPQASGVPKGVKFPSGIVERERRLALGLRFQHGGNAVVDAEVGHYQIDNHAHVNGAKQDGVYVQLRLNALIWKSFGV